MRILHVTPGYAPAWAYGGPARVVYELAHAQRRRGHSVAVFTTDAFLPEAMAAPRERFDDDGIAVVRFRNLNRLLAERLRLFLPSGFPALVERELPAFDVVHVHELRTFYSRTIRRVARRAGVPYAICPHGTATLNDQRVLAKRVFDRAVGARVLGGAAALFALTTAEADDLAALRGRRCPVETIPNGVWLPEPADHAALEARRAAWGVEPGTPLVLYFGRVARAKGIDLLIGAMAAGPLAASGARLVICGPEDGAGAELRALARQLGLGARVRFVDPLYEQEKYVGLQAADVVVVPRFTGQPLVLLEAAACGRAAVVASPHAGLPWLDGSGGLAAEPDPDALGRAIAGALRDGAFSRMGQVARAGVLRAYTWDRIADRYDEAYAAMLRAPAAR